MKIGCSSESFARSIESGELTQLEWLDVCANELEVDGVVFTLAHFPRTDAEYLAQLKKLCADLGLTIAGVAAPAGLWNDGATALDLAFALGAPLVIGTATPSRDDPDAWGTFTEAVKRCARLAKERNVTLAIRNAAGTLCANGADLRRLAKDVDSAWLRFAPALAALDDEDAHTLLPKSAIAIHEIADLETFAAGPTGEASMLIARLARFRAFAILDAARARAEPPSQDHPYHAALERFANLRTQTLAKL
jgi:hypothetical protein